MGWAGLLVVGLSCVAYVLSERPEAVPWFKPENVEFSSLHLKQRRYWVLLTATLVHDGLSHLVSHSSSTD